jgi:2-amino-4-hydroxy-6-hydroxymethyldihydropteridine diphosphokinase
MAYSLLALGSNLRDRLGALRRALAELSHLSGTRLLARSSVHETAPIGGPAGQGAFLNAAVVAQTALAPADLYHELQRIETAFGRQRSEHWAARTIDLDVLLYDEAVIATDELVVPHPRMAYRRFVLEPAAEIAGAALHPESGWTLGALLSHLNRRQDVVAVAASSVEEADVLVLQISQRLGLTCAFGDPRSGGRPTVVAWPIDASSAGQLCPKLLLAITRGGVDSGTARRMLHLPATGPIAWISRDPASSLDEAVAAIQSVWPELAK